VTDFQDQFNSDINAMMAPAFMEAFTAEDGTVITAQFTLFRGEPIADAPGQYSDKVAELRWQESDLSEPIPTYKFKRNKTGLYWHMTDAPENDGFGEIIATITQKKRSRTGAV